MAGRIAYLGNIVTQGLVLDLDAAIQGSYPKTGSLWTDISGNNNNGTLVNGPAYTGSDYGAIVFDGTDDYVNLPSSILLSNISQFSYSSFVKFNPKPSLSGNAFFSYGVSSVYTNDILIAWDRPSSKMFVQVDSGSDGGASFDYTPNNTWVNISVVYNGSLATNSDKLKFYMNGVETSLTFDPGYTVPSTTASPTNPLCWVGGYVSAPGNWFYLGTLANTLLYNRALTQAEITQNFNALRGRYGI